uniref:Uncharacterized protein n=1 Tax=Plectus sambesii TaxID=2011161 RepID=A0A914WCP3_9BILA
MPGTKGPAAAAHGTTGNMHNLHSQLRDAD